MLRHAVVENQTDQTYVHSFYRFEFPVYWVNPRLFANAVDRMHGCKTALVTHVEAMCVYPLAYAAQPRNEKTADRRRFHYLSQVSLTSVPRNSR